MLTDVPSFSDQDFSGEFYSFDDESGLRSSESLETVWHQLLVSYPAG